MTEKTKLADLETYVYIDVSNIRYACLRSCGFRLDFFKLYRYLKKKYIRLKDVRYYEGVEMGDEKKQKYFCSLKSVGYKVCALTRKSYSSPAAYKSFKCEACGHPNAIQIMPMSRKMKSNVDVYLASEMLERAVLIKGAANIILVACDGDYAEAIRAILRLNRKVSVMVLATPTTKKNNCLSARLKELSKEFSSNRYRLINIETIRTLVS